MRKGLKKILRLFDETVEAEKKTPSRMRSTIKKRSHRFSRIVRRRKSRLNALRTWSSSAGKGASTAAAIALPSGF
jgi:hypothetical protein